LIPLGRLGCGEIRQALGVYVVGAIDPAERSVVDRHLATCTACRDELAGLAGLPALLGRVTLEEAERVPSAAETQAPPQLLDSMLTELDKRRRARRRRATLLAVAASAAVIAGGTLAAVGFASGPSARPGQIVFPSPPPAHWTTEQARNAATNVSAIVKYRTQSWGSEIHVWVSGVPADTWCQLVVTDASGRRMVAGGWEVPSSSKGVWYPGSAPVTADSITRFQITSHNRTLVTLFS
jgi:anti-sigma factor RsiW